MPLFSISLLPKHKHTIRIALRIQLPVLHGNKGGPFKRRGKKEKGSVSGHPGPRLRHKCMQLSCVPTQDPIPPVVHLWPAPYLQSTDLPPHNLHLHGRDTEYTSQLSSFVRFIRETQLCAALESSQFSLSMAEPLSQRVACAQL